MIGRCETTVMHKVVLDLGEQEAKELKHAVQNALAADEPVVITQLRCALFNALHGLED